jgi:hypothetical protein
VGARRAPDRVPHPTSAPSGFGRRPMSRSGGSPRPPFALAGGPLAAARLGKAPPCSLLGRRNIGNRRNIGPVCAAQACCGVFAGRRNMRESVRGPICSQVPTVEGG